MVTYLASVQREFQSRGASFPYYSAILLEVAVRGHLAVNAQN